MKELRTRKTNRLKEFEYDANRCYFITICTKEMFQLFGNIKDGKMYLSEVGEIVKNEIDILAQTYESVFVNNSIVMPNHVHLIIKISTLETAPKISQIINQWKRAISIKSEFSPWQKLYHDHIIRNRDSYQRISDYIDNNVINWSDDRFFPKK